jgi:hypothetical protein
LYDPVMARMAGVGAPGIPHHITQRGNRRQTTFFCEEDYSAYIELMSDWGTFLNAKTSAEEAMSIQQHEQTGWPPGNKHFIDDLEKILNRMVRPQKPGPKTSN